MSKFYTADLHHKHKNICKMLDRGYKPNPINVKDLLDGIDPKMYNPYVPTDEAIKINRQRINERLKQMESRGVK